MWQFGRHQYGPQPFDTSMVLHEIDPCGHVVTTDEAMHCGLRCRIWYDDLVIGTPHVGSIVDNDPYIAWYALDDDSTCFSPCMPLCIKWGVLSCSLF